jgi:hypothetical protein
LKRNNSINESKSYEQFFYPQAHIRKNEHDFGYVNEGKKLSYNFLIENNGESELKINKISRCKCLKIIMEKRVISPHSSGKVKVVFDTTGRKEGIIEQNVLFRTNDLNNPILKLKLKATIYKIVSTIPNRIWVGEVTKNVIIKRNFFIKSIDKNLEITNFLTPQGIKASIGEIIEENDNKTYCINLVINIDEHLGDFEKNIKIATNSEIASEVDFCVYGKVVGDIKAIPLYVEFGTIERNINYEKNIKILPREKSVKIDSIKTSSNTIITRLKPHNEQEYNLTVKLLIKDKIEKVNEYITIYYNNDILNIPINATLKDGI